jgi:hypothetical protein
MVLPDVSEMFIINNIAHSTRLTDDYINGKDPIDKEGIERWMETARPSAWRKNTPVHPKAPSHFQFEWPQDIYLRM